MRLLKRKHAKRKAVPRGDPGQLPAKPVVERGGDYNPEVGLGLSAAGREPDDICGVRLVRLRKASEVGEKEPDLEGTPAIVRQHHPGSRRYGAFIRDADLRDRRVELGDAHRPDCVRRCKASLHKGLTSGEALSLNLYKLEQEYLAKSQFTLLLKRDFQLSEFDPTALLSLKTKRSADFALPRWWLDRFDPNCTNRRIRSLAISLPCVTGPYRSVNATLKLTSLSNTLLKTVVLSSGVRDTGWDDGLIEDRYAPFEGVNLDAGTNWHVELPKTTDVDTLTISDLVLHIEYTADEGGPTPQPAPPFKGLFDVKRLSPDAWAQFRAGQGAQKLVIDVAPFLPKFQAGYQAQLGVDCGLYGADGTKLQNPTVVVTARTRIELTWGGAWKEPDVLLLVVDLSP